MNRDEDSTMEMNFSHHATPIKRFQLDRSECGLPIRTSTPISSNANPDADVVRKDSNGHEDTSFRRLRATVLFDTSDGSQFVVSYDAPAPQLESLACGRPGELSVTQAAAMATHGSHVESHHQQHGSSFIARGSVQPTKGSCTDSFLQPSQETGSEVQQQQKSSFARRGSCGDAIQAPERMASTSASSRETMTHLGKPGLGGRSLRTSDGVSQQERPSVVSSSGHARRGRLPHHVTAGLLRTEVGNTRHLASCASKEQAKDEKAPGKLSLKSKDKADQVSRETVVRGNTFTIKSPHSDGLANKPLGRNPSIAVAAKPKLVSDSGSAAKSRFVRTNIPQLSAQKGQRSSKRLSDIGTRKTETAESIRTRSKSTSRTAVELASAAIPHQSTPRCNFRSHKDDAMHGFAKETASMKLVSGKSAPARLKDKLATRDLSKVVQTTKRMPPILKAPSPSLKRTLSTSKEKPNLIDANEVKSSTPTDVTFDSNVVKDLLLKSSWMSKLEEARSEEEKWHVNSIQYQAPIVDSATIQDVKLEPHHSHHNQQQQHQLEKHERRCSMSDVEEEEASLAILASLTPRDSSQLETEATMKLLSVTGGDLRKQWNIKWSDESFELKVALNLSRHVNNLLTQLQQKVSDPHVFQPCLGRCARSSLPRYRSDNQDMHELLENLRSSEKKIKALLEAVEVWSSYNSEVA